MYNPKEIPEVFEPVLFTQLNIRLLGNSKPSTILPLYDVVLHQNSQLFEHECYETIINSVKYN